LEASRGNSDGLWTLVQTGDIGYLDRDGFLSITDRKKDLIKTSGGKFIAPQPIENSLKVNPFIGTAVVFGDRRKFPAVLIAPHFPALEDWHGRMMLSLPREKNSSRTPRCRRCMKASSKP